MTFPNFFKSMAFWKAASLIVATLVVYFFPEYKLTAAMVEAVVYAVLSLFGITPELQARAALKAKK
jgi:hypothetical protein